MQLLRLRTLRFFLFAAQGSSFAIANTRQRLNPNGLGIRMVATGSTMPKIETGISSLLEGSPEADGRGTLVAVLDTGCDLAAAGLLKTSDGKPKYVDFLDCTGSGDVDTSKVASRGDDGMLEGVSGRKLTLGAWADGVDEFRVAAVRLFALLPRSVLGRIKRERKTKFEAEQHAAMTAAMVALEAATKGGDKAAKADAEAVVAELKEAFEGYSDSGPLLDVVLYKAATGGGGWRAVVQTDEGSGAGAVDLSGVAPIAPYREAQQVGDLGFGTALSFCVQVPSDDGHLLQIVVDAGSHGTHVAGIVAANFDGEASERNGVAPGAQILACKIGDGRLGSAETGTGLVRALIAAKKAGCDLINLSYGEPFWQADYGRVSETFDAAVRKWGMTVFTSAGNDGPALSSLGAPGHLTTPITVGAYVSTRMMADQYSMLEGDEEVASTSYSFSSRGPTPDGYLPTLCAPGGAISPIPRHCLQGKAQYHGTSMSSPNACGVAACVLSALRQAGVHPNPIELRRALENSAVAVETSDVFAQGAGLINAPAAIEYAKAHHGKAAQDVEFAVSVPSRQNARGIYLRDSAELASATPLTIGVHVKPLFEHAITRSESELAELLDLELDLLLRPSSEDAAAWIATPESMVLTSGQDRGGQSFAVRLDVSKLPPGAHYAEVEALDKADLSRGPLFRVPVTVVVPHATLPSTAAAEPITMPMELPAGAPVRRFLAAPPDAEWATVKVRTEALPKGPHSVILHAVPSARGDVPNTALQVKKMLSLREHSEEVLTVPVRGGSTLELCWQLSWLANPSPVGFDAAVEFHSYGMRGGPMLPHNRPLRIGASDTYARLEVGAPLRSEAVRPKATLKAVERSLLPVQSTISPASAELDVLPPSDAELKAVTAAAATAAAATAAAGGTQLHQMVLKYEFEVSPPDKEESLKVTPRVPSLHEQLYDAPLDSMLWRLESSSGEILEYGGAMHDASPASLKKGSYALSLLVRHPDASQLEALKALPMMLKIGLSKPIGLKVYADRGSATAAGHGSGAKTIGDAWLKRGGHKNLYVSKPSAALPSWTSAGDSLVGELLIDKECKGGSTSMPLVYEVPPPAPKKDKGASSASGNGNGGGGKEEGEAKAKAKAAQNADQEEEAAKEAEEKAKEKELATDMESLDKAILEAALGRLTSLRLAGASAERYDNVLFEVVRAGRAEKQTENLRAHRTHLPLLLEILAWKRGGMPLPEGLEPETDAAAEWRCSEVADAAALFLQPDGPIDGNELAAYWGISHDVDGPDAPKAAKDKAKEMEEQRSALRLALFANAEAVAAGSTAAATLERVVMGSSADDDASEPPAPAPPAPAPAAPEPPPVEVVASGAAAAAAATPPPPPPALPNLASAVKEMQKWVTSAEDLPEEERDSHAVILARHHCALGRPGAAVAALRARLKAQPAGGPKANKVLEEMKGLYLALGWEHWAKNMDEVMAEKYPSAKVPL